MGHARAAVVASILVAGAVAGYAGCAALPYLGAGYDVSQTMYSNLRIEAGGNNHLFLPQATWTGLGVYVIELTAEVRGAPARGPNAARASFLAGGRGRELNLESVRVAVAGLCAGGASVALRYRIPGGGERAFADACAAAELRPHDALPVRIYVPARGPR